MNAQVKGSIQTGFIIVITLGRITRLGFISPMQKCGVGKLLEFLDNPFPAELD
jgi:hypothetical protein